MVHLPPHTLVLVTGGTYEGYIARIDYYTPQRVWVWLLEDPTGTAIHRIDHQLTSPQHVRRMPATHPRRMYTRNSSRLRQAVIDLIVAYVSETDSGPNEIQSLLEDAHQQWGEHQE
jgi:hypothetical protein